MGAKEGMMTLVEILPSDSDAIEIGDLYRRGKLSIVESVQYLLDCGQRLAAKKAQLGHGGWLPWLRANTEIPGFGERAAQTLMKRAANTQLTSDLTEDDAIQINRTIWGNLNYKALASGSESDECYTPKEYVDRARAVLGNIDLDPASCDEAQRTIAATRFYSAEDNGLVLPWHGRIWLNPPYSSPLLGLFVDKLLDELSDDRASAAVLLTHNATDTAWFHKAAELATRLCFLRGRIDFTGSRAPWLGSIFYYFGDNPEGFERAFSPIGLVR